MTDVMTLEELRDYIRSMPEDEILCITLEEPVGKEVDHAGEKESG